MASNGSGARLAVFDAGPQSTLLDWSRDGTLAFQRRDERTGWDLWIASAAGGVPVQLRQTPFNEENARLSPDNRWMTYTSDESGRREIYVRPFPDGPVKVHYLDQRW